MKPKIYSLWTRRYPKQRPFMIYRIVWSISIRFPFIAVGESQKRHLLLMTGLCEWQAKSIFVFLLSQWMVMATGHDGTSHVDTARHFSVAGKLFRCYRTTNSSKFLFSIRASACRCWNSSNQFSVIFWFDNLMNSIWHTKILISIHLIEWQTSYAKYSMWLDFSAASLDETRPVKIIKYA